MSNQHVLKIHPAPLADLLSGAKTAEVRRNDRGFQVGDTVRLTEVNPETGNWTGAADHVRTISHVQTGYGLPDGMCVLSYAQPAAGEPIQVEAVATTREDEDGLYLDWVLEGGISALEAPGVTLLVAHGTLTNAQGSGEVYLASPAAAPGNGAPGTVRVNADWLRKVHRDLDACQKVIWLAGCGSRGYGFDPAYCEGAQARLREIDEQIARAKAARGAQHA